MIIKRDGKEYILTEQELREAYTNQQHKYDRMDVEMVLDECDEDYTEEQFIDRYGFTPSCARENIDWLADQKRDIQDGDGIGWRDAVYLSFEQLLIKVREA